MILEASLSPQSRPQPRSLQRPHLPRVTRSLGRSLTRVARLSAQPSRTDLQTCRHVETGKILTDQHHDHLIHLPAEIEDYERVPLELEEARPAGAESHRESLGQLLENRTEPKPQL